MFPTATQNTLIPQEKEETKRKFCHALRAYQKKAECVSVSLSSQHKTATAAVAFKTFNSISLEKRQHIHTEERET